MYLFIEQTFIELLFPVNIVCGHWGDQGDQVTGPACVLEARRCLRCVKRLERSSEAEKAFELRGGGKTAGRSWHRSCFPKEPEGLTDSSSRHRGRPQKGKWSHLAVVLSVPGGLGKVG